MTRRTSLQSCLDGRRKGVALLVVLWCLVLLTLAGTSALHTSTLDIRVAKNHGDKKQAYYLALAGIETAKARIYKDSEDRKKSGSNHVSRLTDDPSSFRDQELGRGTFSILRGARDDERGQGQRNVIYGLQDEGGKINVNSASAEALLSIPGMTTQIVAAIIDWRDGDQKMTPEGAEQDYYLGLREPYTMRNGPLQTLRELLRVRGVGEDYLLGEDANFNGILDPEERDGNESYPPDDRNRTLNGAWSKWLTVHSAVPNEDRSGEFLVNVQTAKADRLSDLPGVSPELADAMVKYREKQSFDTIGHLLDVTYIVENPQNPNPNPNGEGSRDSGESPPAPDGNRGNDNSNNNGQPQGNPLISPQLLQEFAGEITTRNDLLLVGVINVNEADATVLASLPDVDRDLADAIVARRQGYGDFQNLAYLLEVPGLSKEIFKKICPLVTTSAGTYRILAEGKVKSTGATQLVEVVVRSSRLGFDVLAYRDDF